MDPERVNTRRLEVSLAADPATAPHGGGVLVIDEHSQGWQQDRACGPGAGRAGMARPTMAWSPSPRCGPMSGCITRCMRCPIHRPGTSRRARTTGRSGTKLQIGASLAVQAKAAGFTFRAVAADSAYGDQDGFRGQLADAGLPYVMALKPRRGTWAYGADAHTPVDAARALAWNGAADPGDWRPVTRAFRDGHAETWHAAEAEFGWWGPDGARRLVAATADPATLPAKATWYLVTNLPRPGGPREQAGSPHPAADLAEMCGPQRDPALDRAKLQTGQGRAGLGRLPGPLRHRDPPPPGPGQLRVLLLLGRLVRTTTPAPHEPGTPRTDAGRGERGHTRRRTAAGTVLAAGIRRDTRLASPPRSRCSAGGRRGQTAPPPPPAASPDRLGRGRQRPAPLQPDLTNWRYVCQGILGSACGQ